MNEQDRKLVDLLVKAVVEKKITANEALRIIGIRRIDTSMLTRKIDS